MSEERYFPCPYIFGITCSQSSITNIGVCCEDKNFSKLILGLTIEDIDAMKKMRRGKKLDKFVTDKMIEYNVYCCRSEDK